MVDKPQEHSEFEVVIEVSAEIVSVRKYEKIEPAGEFGPYNVDKSSEPWVLSVPNRRTIRLHTSPYYRPYSDFWTSPQTRFEIHSGQWVEGYQNNAWTLLTDADHR